MYLHVRAFAAKLLWQGAECWKESLKLLSIAEAAIGLEEANSELEESGQDLSEFVVRRRFVSFSVKFLFNFIVNFFLDLGNPSQTGAVNKICALG